MNVNHSRLRIEKDNFAICQTIRTSKVYTLAVWLEMKGREVDANAVPLQTEREPQRTPEQPKTIPNRPQNDPQTIPN